MLSEEYKFDDRMYEDMVNQESLKVLSVDFESDRYNFALLCTVQLRYTFESFRRRVGPVLATEEAIELGCVDLRDIPEVLVGYGDEAGRAGYHPSTYLRLLLFLVHKSGYARAERQILVCRDAVGR